MPRRRTRDARFHTIPMEDYTTALRSMAACYATLRAILYSGALDAEPYRCLRFSTATAMREMAPEGVGNHREGYESSGGLQAFRDSIGTLERDRPEIVVWAEEKIRDGSP